MNHKDIHPLASGKTYFIEFVHEGETHVFVSTINEMSGERLSYFDNDAPTYDSSGSWARSVMKGIRSRAEILQDVVVK